MSQQVHDATQDLVLHIHLLGDFRLAYDDDPVTDIDTARLQSLLAYLLLHRDAPQSRHHLAFLFWSDSTESQALTNLRHLLYQIRHALPEANRFLRIGRQTLQWQPDAPFTLDVADFERALIRADQAEQADNQKATQEALEEAVTLYGGDLLPSCYEDWIFPERERLRQAFTEALERLIQLLEERRDYHAAIGYAQRLVRHDPLREASYRRLMRLRALVGDRAGAVRTYHECATVLERELDVAPSPTTREMYEQLVAMEEAPTPRLTATERRGGISPLVGRREAWSRLHDAWRKASARQPHVVSISGEAGIGKTRLAEELVQWAKRQSITTATARCYAAEGELSYAPVVAWLRALPLPRLGQVWLSEIARILPELLAEQPELTRPGPLTEAWQRRRFFEALARAVLGGDKPLLLLIDALQWCDRGTLEWLHYLLRFDSRARLLVVGTYRPESIEPDHPLTSLLHTLRQDDQLTEIALDPLSKRETGTLAENVADRELEPNLVDCLYGETEGNPLFIVETVRAGLPDEVRTSPSGGLVCIPRPLPSRIKDALMTRVGQISPSARALAELAATIGREFTFEVLREATDTDEDALVRELDELWQREIIREQDRAAYDFSHDKLREVIYEGLSKARRRILHRHVAQALERVYSDNLEPVVARVAAHYERADEAEQAIECYRHAAEVALTMQAEEDANRYRQRADDLLKEIAFGES
jgi:DNA-binding SARP family transcriptional activator